MRQIEEKVDLDQQVNNMKYYLRIATTYFYDPHGTPDEGGIQKSVLTEDDLPGVTIDGEYINSEAYNNYLYCKGDEENEEDDDFDYFLTPDDYEKIMEFSGEDGYNCEETTYTFKEITQEQYLDYLEIIDKYNNI